MNQIDTLLETAAGWVKGWELTENWAEAQHEQKMIELVANLRAWNKSLTLTIAAKEAELSQIRALLAQSGITWPTP